MRKPLLAALSLTVLWAGCQNKTPSGPGVVKITETTTTTSTTTTTTTTIAVATVASFTFSPLTPQEEQVVNFNASGSTPGSGRTLVSYSWDFGDGESKTGITTTHDYKPSGVYLVTLTVTDDLGQKTTGSQPITIRPKP
jgi:PKD repeat protein